MRKLLLIPWVLLMLLSCEGRPRQFVQIQGYAQGGTYTVKMNLSGVQVPVETIRDSVDALLLRIDTTLSGYNKNSLLSRYNAGQAVPATPLFLDMYRLGYSLWERSGGALDFAAGPLYDAWGFGFKSSSFPTDQAVRELLENCGMGRLPAQLPVKDGITDPADVGYPRLNYNAIAQGYSCDLIARYLYSIGVKDMLVDIGEIWCDGLNPAGAPWTVGIDRPEDQAATDRPSALEGIWLSGGKPCGIVTSGNYRKFYIRDGRKYAHTIDPRVGYPVTHNLLSASVVSSVSAAESDAVATWCMVVGLEEARKLILDHPGLEAYLIYDGPDGTMQEWASPGFTVRQ